MHTILALLLYVNIFLKFIYIYWPATAFGHKNSEVFNIDKSV